MGIPSYYKKILEKHPKVLCSSCPLSAAALYFDFNCLIYYVARRSTMAPYPGEDGKDEWEAQLLDEIQRYVVQVWNEAGRPAEVFLAVDGVVPMAKIRQQRMRRFKSVWLAAEERRMGLRGNEPSWDTNCITPGTAFMRKLGVALQKLCDLRKGWSVSDSQQPGEGEHKIMERLRRRQDGDSTAARPIIVYGLDADLILLTMLNAGRPAYLMREQSEMGIVQKDTLGKEQYRWLDIEALKAALVPSDVDSSEWIHNYIAAMSLLGNDFLPHSCSITIKHDGHTILLEALEAVLVQGRRMCREEDGTWRIDRDGLLCMLTQFANQEEMRMCQVMKKKLQMQGKVTTYNALERRPLEWAVESEICRRTDDQGWALQSGWQDVYAQTWLVAADHGTYEGLCREYVCGLQWVLDYYTGQTQVPFTWFFPRSLPPLWVHLAQYVAGQTVLPVLLEANQTDIRPEEQLAMVLPLPSWHLIQDRSLRSLPVVLPMFWPSRFEFLSVGRTWLWECEPKIPILTLERLRSHVSRNTAFSH